MALADRFSPNPDYGAGIYRRRIHLRKAPGVVLADLLDDYHDMGCSLHHDGEVVTRMQSSIRRAPFSTCAGATVRTDELVGLPLGMARRDLYGEQRPQRNCTHVFDLVAFAMSHAASNRQTTTIEFVLPDLVPSGAHFQVLVDGTPAFDWTVFPDEVIQAPPQYRGRSFFKGYARWAEATFTGFDLEIALHMQKVILVARGRRWRIEDESRNSIREEPERLGVCFTFSEPQFSVAQANRDYVRDFTNGLPIL